MNFYTLSDLRVHQTTLDEAVTCEQVRTKGNPTQEHSKHSSKFIFWILPFPQSKKHFGLLYSVNSQANLAWPCMGGCINQYHRPLGTVPQLCTKSPWLQPWGQDKVTQPLQLIFKGYPVFNSPSLFKVNLDKSQRIHLSFCNLKLVKLPNYNSLPYNCSWDS